MTARCEAGQCRWAEAYEENIRLTPRGDVLTRNIKRWTVCERCGARQKEATS